MILRVTWKLFLKERSNLNKCAVTAAETTSVENEVDEDPAANRPSGSRQLSK